jgi:hypothetical protein
VAEPALGREAQVALATETLADDFRGSEPEPGEIGHRDRLGGLIREYYRKAA